MSLSTDISKNYSRAEQSIRRLELVYKTVESSSKPQYQPDRIWTSIKSKVTVELAPVLKKLTSVEKTRITMKDAESLINLKLEKLDKQNRRQHDDLYNRLREL